MKDIIEYILNPLISTYAFLIVLFTLTGRSPLGVILFPFKIVYNVASTVIGSLFNRVVVEFINSLFTILQKSIYIIFFPLMWLFKYFIRPDKSTNYFLNDYHLIFKKVWNSSNKGVLLGDKSITTEQSSKGVLFLSPTGGGKSTSFVIPNILRTERPNKSIVVTDPSGEIREFTSGYMAKIGFDIVTINLDDIFSSDRWNPLENLSSMSEDELNSIAFILTNEENSTDRFWQQQAQGLIYMLLRVLSYQDEEYHHLGQLKRLLFEIGTDDGESGVMELIIQSNDKDLSTKYLAFVNSDDRMKSNTLSSATNSLTWLSNDLERILTKSTFDMNSLRTTPTIVYIVCNEAKMGYYEKLLGLLFQTLFTKLLNSGRRQKNLEVMLLVDEFAQLPYIPILPTFATTVRKRKVSLSLYIQAISQIYAKYKTADSNTLLNGAIKNFVSFGNIDLESAKVLQEKVGKDIISYNEIMRMDDEFIAIINSEPFRAKLKPYFKNRKFLKRSKMKPFKAESSAIKVNYIELPEMPDDE
jgi:type IV secretion system protein VirD4